MLIASFLVDWLCTPLAGAEAHHEAAEALGQVRRLDFVFYSPPFFG